MTPAPIAACTDSELSIRSNASARRFARPLRSLLLGAFSLALLAAGGPGQAEARGGGGGAPPAPAPAPAPARPGGGPEMGSTVFDQCVRWVSAGGTGIAQTQDFYVNIIAELDLDTMTHRGPMRLWWQLPDRYRQELTVNRQVTTKILNGDQLWIVDPSGKAQRMHGTAGGVNAILQLKQDRDRLGDLAQFLTLQSLRSEGAEFVYEGTVDGTGTYAGSWMKLSRTAPGSATMQFWIAYQRGADGRPVATWPGIVRILGEPERNIPTEDYILRNWMEPARTAGVQTFRYPQQIEAYSLMPGRPPVRFLRATVRDIKINGGIDPSRFMPPGR